MHCAGSCGRLGGRLGAQGEVIYTELQAVSLQWALIHEP
jgi:hypothetical protein